MRPQWIKGFTWFLIIVIGLAVILSAFLLFFPQLLPKDWPDQPSDRIALAQLAMEFAGVLALSWVAWEFYQSQKKPKLRLLIKNPLEQDDNIIPTEKLKVVRRPNHGFLFEIYIENFGDAPARWVNVSINVKFPDNNLQLRSSNNPAGNWSEPKGSINQSFDFYGGDNLTVYNHPRNPNAPECVSWLDNLGRFGFTSNSWEEYPGQNHGRIYLHYSIKSDGFAIFKQQIPIDVIDETKE